MWLMPTQLSAPLATHNVNQRKNLSMAFTVTRNIGTGLVSILFPTLLSAVIGMAKGNDAGGYLLCVAIISGIAIPLLFIQYFYTRERITEENRAIREAKESRGAEELSLWRQFKVAVHDKYWVIFMVVLIFSELFANLRNISLVYYTGWVVRGNAYGEMASIQAKFQMIAMSPMGPGLLLLLPLVKKWGRQRCIWVGGTLTTVGSTIAFLNAGSSMMIYAGSALAAFGNIAFNYTVITYLGDVIDHVEWKTGKRVEGISGGITGAVTCLAVGLAQGIFNLGLMITKYEVPQVIGEVDGIMKYADQPAAASGWINFAYQGTYIIMGLMYFLVFLRLFNLDKHLPSIQHDIEERKIAECKAAGIDYVPAAEQQRLEIEKQQREAEENRIRELKNAASARGWILTRKIGKCWTNGQRSRLK